MPLQLSPEEMEVLEQAVGFTLSRWDSTGSAAEQARLCCEIARITAAAAEHCLAAPQLERETTAEVSTPVAHYRVSTTFIRGTPETPDTIVALVDSIDSTKVTARELAARFFLTKREIEAAQLARKGLSSREIGAALGISVNTARRHIESVLAKLGVHSRAALISRLEEYCALLLSVPYVAAAIGSQSDVVCPLVVG